MSRSSEVNVNTAIEMTNHFYIYFVYGRKSWAIGKITKSNFDRKHYLKKDKHISIYIDKLNLQFWKGTLCVREHQTAKHLIELIHRFKCMQFKIKQSW